MGETVSMKQFLLSLLLGLLFAPMRSTAQIDKGYHGFVDAGYSFSVNGGTTDHGWAEVNTIHGYEVNPHFFIGAGIGFHFMEKMEDGFVSGVPMWKRDAKMDIPLFADFKWNILNKKVTPFVDARLGHYLTNESGTYISVGVGCRYALKRKQAVYAIVSYSAAELQYQKSHYISGKYSGSWSYTDFDETRNNLSVKLGYEF